MDDLIVQFGSDTTQFFGHDRLKLSRKLLISVGAPVQGNENSSRALDISWGFLHKFLIKFGRKIDVDGCRYTYR